MATERTKTQRQFRPLLIADIIIVGIDLAATAAVGIIIWRYGGLPETQPLAAICALVLGINPVLIAWWLTKWVKMQPNKISVRTTIGGGYLYSLIGKNDTGFLNQPWSKNYDDRYKNEDIVPTRDIPGSSNPVWGSPGYETDTEATEVWVDDRPRLEKLLGFRFTGFLSISGKMLEHVHYTKTTASVTKDEKVVFTYGEYSVIEKKSYVTYRSLFWEDIIVIKRADTGAGSYGKKGPLTEEQDVELLSVDITLKGLFRIRNMYTLFTKGVDTHHAARNPIEAIMRDFVGTLDIDQLISMKHADKKTSDGKASEFLQLIPLINAYLIEMGFELTGNFFLESIEPGDENAERMFAAQQKEFIAKKEGNALKITAEAQGDAEVALANKKSLAYTTLRTAQATADGNYNEKVILPVLEKKYAAIGKLSEVKGTLVINTPIGDDKDIIQQTQTMITLPATLASEAKHHPKPEPEPEGDKHGKTSDHDEEEGGGHDH